MTRCSSCEGLSSACSHDKALSPQRVGAQGLSSTSLQHTTYPPLSTLPKLTGTVVPGDTTTPETTGTPFAEQKSACLLAEPFMSAGPPLSHAAP